MIIAFFIPHSGCPHQCVFCNQKRITGQNKPPDLSIIQQKITDYLATNRADSADIAFYGGTFTALPLQKQQAYLAAVQPFISAGQIRSIRVSTRPDCISREVLALLKRNNVHTIELGVQSMDDRVLALSGRGHSAADTANAVKQLNDLAFTVGLQLMPGLPGDSGKIWIETVEKSISLEPDFIRIYPALVIKDTPLENLYTSGGYAPLTLDEAVILCKSALLKFESAGIEVIRIGLQPTEELEKPGTVVAGPYHPAFRQLVESAILLDIMRLAMRDRKDRETETIVRVNPAELSTAIGQKQSNIRILEKEFGLKKVEIRADGSVLRRTVKFL